MSEIASCMLRYKRYPDKDDYINVARSIIAKYPFFKPKDGNPCVSYPISIHLMLLLLFPLYLGCYCPNLNKQVQEFRREKVMFNTIKAKE